MKGKGVVLNTMSSIEGNPRYASKVTIAIQRGVARQLVLWRTVISI